MTKSNDGTDELGAIFNGQMSAQVVSGDGAAGRGRGQPEKHLASQKIGHRRGDVGRQVGQFGIAGSCDDGQTQHHAEQDDEEGTITIYGDPKSYAAIQKHLEECGFEDVGGDFTYIPNDLKEVTPEQRETLDKMIERLEEFDDVQTVYTNMQPEEGE